MKQVAACAHLASERKGCAPSPADFVGQSAIAAGHSALFARHFALFLPKRFCRRVRTRVTGRFSMRPTLLLQEVCYALQTRSGTRDLAACPAVSGGEQGASRAGD